MIPPDVRIRANNNWRDDPAQEALIEATGIPPTDDLEAAIVATLQPGSLHGDPPRQWG